MARRLNQNGDEIARWSESIRREHERRANVYRQMNGFEKGEAHDSGYFYDPNYDKGFEDSYQD